MYNDFDLQEDLKALKSWLEKSPHLKNARQGAKLSLDSAMSTDLHFLGFPVWSLFSDDAKLLQFLRGCKFSLERTKEKLDLYNSCRSKLTWMLYLIFCLEGKCKGRSDFRSGEKNGPLRASLPDWFEPWDPSGPIFQKVLNFRWEPQK